MLLKDSEDFENKYPVAAAHIRAANLREEFYRLASWFDRGRRKYWELRRMKELLNAPAVHKLWFIDKLAEDFGGDIFEAIENVIRQVIGR